jgi:hypothetical protein
MTTRKAKTKASATAKEANAKSKRNRVIEVVRQIQKQ